MGSRNFRHSEFRADICFRDLASYDRACRLARRDLRRGDCGASTVTKNAGLNVDACRLVDRSRHQHSRRCFSRGAHTILVAATVRSTAGPACAGFSGAWHGARSAACGLDQFRQIRNLCAVLLWQQRRRGHCRQIWTCRGGGRPDDCGCMGGECPYRAKLGVGLQAPLLPCCYHHWRACNRSNRPASRSRLARADRAVCAGDQLASA